jgi:hypothetical protein
MTDVQISAHELSLIGKLVEGRVEAVFRWGVIVDLGLSRVGLIDALYVDDDDKYEVDQHVACFLDEFDEKKNEFILRPPSQTPLIERLRQAGHDL